MKTRLCAKLFPSPLILLVLLISFPHTSLAENGGAAVAKNKRSPHESVGATVWPAGPHLIEPCTAEILCENVILTTTHCLNFNYTKGDMYFTLTEDLNALGGGADRYAKVAALYGDDKTRTAKIDRDSITYGPFHNYAGAVLPVGLAMAKFKKGDTIAASYPNFVAQNFTPKADGDAFDPRNKADTFLRPGKVATEFFVSGYGFNASQRRAPVGTGILRSGTMRFLSWIDPRNGQGSADTAPAGTNAVEGFMFQLSRSNGTVNGCQGDSGGPMWANLGDKGYRLAGTRDLISDPACAGGEFQPPGGGPTHPHFDTFTSLVYTPNRTFVRKFMLDNCSDQRAIDVKTGDNEVQKKDDEEEDQCPDDPEKLDAGMCGCGLPETDSDGDGFPDCVDMCPDDAVKSYPGTCGCGRGDIDSDDDGIVECDSLPSPTPSATSPSATTTTWRSRRTANA